MSRRLLLPLAVIALLLPTAAQAGDYDGRDRIGDVEGFIYDPDPRPCGSFTDVRHEDPRFNDITRLDVLHSRTKVQLAMHLRDLPSARQGSQTFYLRTPRKAFSIDLMTDSGEAVASLSVEKPPPPSPGPCGFSIVIGPGGCRGLTATVDREANTVGVSVTRRCLGAPTWVRAGAYSYAFVRRASHHDHWAPRGAKPSGPWQHVYGPRVRASR